MRSLDTARLHIKELVLTLACNGLCQDLLLCAGHGTILTGGSPVTGIYRQV